MKHPNMVHRYKEEDDHQESNKSIHNQCMEPKDTSGSHFNVLQDMETSENKTSPLTSTNHSHDYPSQVQFSQAKQRNAKRNLQAKECQT